MGPPNTKKPFSLKDQGTDKKKSRKKTKRKPALSKEEREKEKLAKAAEEFQRDSQEYGLFLDRMDKWLKTHQEQAMQLLGKYDWTGNGILHYEEFKLGMRDLKIPCVEAQLHILARLLDPNNTGTIDYVELGAGLERARYVSLDLRLISFSTLSSHPGHLQRNVPSHVKVYGLIGQIRAWTGIESTTLRIFKDQSCSQESCLPLELSLEECGFPGGPCHLPTSALLFYDYWIEFGDCPILNCDHYINFRKL